MLVIIGILAWLLLDLCKMGIVFARFGTVVTNYFSVIDLSLLLEASSGMTIILGKMADDR